MSAVCLPSRRSLTPMKPVLFLQEMSSSLPCGVEWRAGWLSAAVRRGRGWRGAHCVPVERPQQAGRLPARARRVAPVSAQHWEGKRAWSRSWTCSSCLRVCVGLSVWACFGGGRGPVSLQARWASTNTCTHAHTGTAGEGQAVQGEGGDTAHVTHGFDASSLARMAIVGPSAMMRVRGPSLPCRACHGGEGPIAEGARHAATNAPCRTHTHQPLILLLASSLATLRPRNQPAHHLIPAGAAVPILTLNRPQR